MHYRNMLKTSLLLAAIGCYAMVAGGRAAAQEGRQKGPTPVTTKTLGLSATPALSPAAAGSFSSHLTTTPDGKLLLSWLEPGGEKALALKYAIHHAGQWSPARTVAANEQIVRYPSVPPVVTALANGRFIACWTEERKGGKGKWPPEDFHFSVSPDGGKTWDKPQLAHWDLSESEHSFVSVTPTGADEITAVWLDGRTGKQSLMAARIKTDGTASEEKMLDADVCTCCPTALARTADGLIAAYRDHEGEMRDISVMRLRDGQWSEPRPLHRDGWKIDGCPVNGA
ncbi:MAG: sialidase family protein, partial [Pseudomonadota bacterium]